MKVKVHRSSKDAPFLVIHFSFYTSITFLMMLPVILLSMLIILISALNVIRQLICCICSNSPVLNGRLPLWEHSCSPPVSHWHIPFWDDPGLLVKYLWILQVYHTFYKLDVKILAAINEIKSMRCSWSLSSPWAVDPCQQRTYYFSTIERTHGKFSQEIDRKSLKIDTVCNF